MDQNYSLQELEVCSTADKYHHFGKNLLLLISLQKKSHLDGGCCRFPRKIGSHLKNYITRYKLA
jgi:hypothetical protein